MARFKSNKKKLYIGFIGEREAAEYIATSNIALSHNFLSVCFTNISSLVQYLVAFFTCFSCNSCPLQIWAAGRHKKIDQIVGPFPLNFNLVQGEIGFWSMKCNRASEKITTLFHLNPGCQTKSSKRILRSHFLPFFIQVRLPSCPIGFHVLSATICSHIHGNHQ